MERSEVLDWLTQHTEYVHDIPEQLLSRCEREVKQHAQEDAWLHARDIAQQHSHDWRHFWGAHASEAYIAREACRDLAEEFKHNVPAPLEGHESDFVDDDVLSALDPEARSVLFEYVHDLALGEERRAWKQITRFTRKRGRKLAREEHLSSNLSFEGTNVYSETAIRVMEILARDFQRRAHAH
ncbi:MAG: hypothetical protein JRE43_05940 [Deltaproteobacteria bacterium]|jgi:hypothetical protein|nr:hypothetical protein [Deltaproteobacteria bacterium]MBW2542086.1 hypothetical protein [Deltaproteobacteria bacterium]